jgi:hypothetical protein
MNTAEAVRTAPPPHAMLQLQRTLGNQGVVSMIARNGKKKPPPKPIDIDVDDAAGTIKTTAGELIGFKTGSDWYATPGAAAPGAAKRGELETSAGKLDILKVRKSTVTVGADGSETMTQDGAESGAVLGTTPALVVGGKSLVELSKLPAALKSTIPANSRITVDGTIYLAIQYPDGTGLNWVKSKHSRKEYAGRQKLMEDAIATLPAGLKARITPELDFMAMISMLEGTFGSVSESFWTPYCKHESHGKAGWKGTRTRSKADADKAVAEHEKANKDHDADVSFSGDSAASLGIHQWAMDKDTAGGGGSLVEFFKTLQSRATKAEAKKATDRTEEETIYVEAWGQCTTAGLKIVDGKLQINGKDATGLEVEGALAGPMATGGLRKYQVIMIAEELEELWAKPLVPGMFGSQMIGNKYVTSSETKDATFGTDKYTIKLSAPAKVATIGEVCTDERLKLAVANIFPNRPAWMGAIVWRSLVSGDPQALAADLIAKIVKAEEAKPPPPADAKKEPEAKPDAKKKPAKAKAPAKPEITEAMAADKQSFKDLQALVWPSGDKADQDKVLAQFNATVLQFYKGEDEKTLPGNDWKSHPKKTAKTGRKLRYGWKSRAERLASADAGN